MSLCPIIGCPIKQPRKNGVNIKSAPREGVSAHLLFDKSERIGIRVIDLINTENLRQKLEWTINYKNVILEKLYNLPPLDAKTVIEEYLEYAEKLRPHVVDSSLKIYEAIRKRKNILFEGTEGTLLDLDHGTYP
jgi:adenylosuccinate synthase